MAEDQSFLETVVKVLRLIKDFILISIGLILIVTLVYLLLRPIFKGSYPRITTFSNSVDVMDYTVNYLSNLQKLINSVVLEMDTSIMENYKELLDLGILPSNSSTKLLPESYPIPFMYFAFKEELKKNKRKAVSKWKTLFNTTKIRINNESVDVYDEDKINIEKEHFELIKEHTNKLDTFLNSLEKATIDTEKMSKLNQFHLREINLLLNYYDDISYLYKNRKASGFYLISHYARDATIALGYKLQTWAHWDVPQLAETIREFLGGEKAQAFMMNLVIKMAGADSEKDEEKKEEDSGGGGGGGGGGGVPGPFGEVVNAAIGFATIGIAIGESIMKIITNPLSIIQFIIGIIIGLTIYVIWFLFCVVLASIMSYAWAAVGFFFIKLFSSTLALSLWLFNMIIYFIIAIIDIPLKGAISRTMRCEDVPNTWHTRPNIQHNNVHKRMFFCNKACAKRYIPSKDYWWCHRLKSYHPSFCPQANIYNLYLLSKSVGKKPSNPIYFNFKPNIKYYGKSEKDKLSTIKDSFDEKIDFVSLCDRKLSKYDFITKFICNNTDELIKDSDISQSVKQLCKLQYCELDINDVGDASLIDLGKIKEKDCGFCEESKDKVGDQSADESVPSVAEDNLFIKCLSIIYLLIFILLIFRIVIELSERVTFD